MLPNIALKKIIDDFSELNDLRVIKTLIVFLDIPGISTIGMKKYQNTDLVLFEDEAPNINKDEILEFKFAVNALKSRLINTKPEKIDQYKIYFNYTIDKVSSLIFGLIFENVDLLLILLVKLSRSYFKSKPVYIYLQIKNNNGFDNECWKWV